MGVFLKAASRELLVVAIPGSGLPLNVKDSGVPVYPAGITPANAREPSGVKTGVIFPAYTCVLGFPR